MRPGIAARNRFIEASELRDTFIGHFISITFDRTEKVFECAARAQIPSTAGEREQIAFNYTKCLAIDH